MGIETKTVKVGDRVKTKGPYSFDPTEGEVAQLGDNFVHVKIGPDVWAYKSSEVELLPVAATGTTESQPATLTIEAGKFYRTRDGRKVGPMEPWFFGGWHADRAPVPLNGGLWDDNGMAWFDNSKDSPDLIAEWVDELTNDNTPPVEEQQGSSIIASADSSFVIDFSNGTLTMDTDKFDVRAKSMLVRTKRGYGFEIARHGDYVWVDTGLHAPIAFKAANVHAA